MIGEKVTALLLTVLLVICIIKGETVLFVGLFADEDVIKV